MSTGNQLRTRSDLVAGVRLPKGNAAQCFEYLRQTDVLLRLATCLVAAMAMWAITLAWAPRLMFHAGYTPQRNIVARVDFSDKDPQETDSLRKQARQSALCVYEHDKQPIVELRTALKDSVFQITNAESFQMLQKQDAQVWAEFMAESDESSELNEELLFNDFREALADDTELSRFEFGIQAAVADFERDGLLVTLSHELEEGSQTAILVHDAGTPNIAHRVSVRDVRIAEAAADLQQNLKREFVAVGIPENHIETVSQLVMTWLKNKKLPTTLTLNKTATERSRAEAAKSVPEATIDYKPGDTLVKGGEPLAKEQIDLLRLEHRNILAKMSLSEKVRHSLADIGMYVALYVLCGSYIYFHHRNLLTDFRRLASMLGLVVATVTLCVMAANDQWRAEVIPLILFATTVTIAYKRELALLLSAAVSLVITLSLGRNLPEFVIHVAAVASAVLLLGRVRSRTKLIYVGLGAAAVAALTTIGIGTFTGQTYGWTGQTNMPFELSELIRGSFLSRLLIGAGWYGFCAILAGVLMTGLLPFIERVFDVQTDISLLELGDAAHPLLQELVRRAPGTYNHSITVASIAEAAADAIGANGLLVRVGAYFHDIGKMLKPGYFIENQSQGANRHDSLMPAMSTLVIIAHVKDGADLARQHRLPRSIIDFIEQHHGTTLVEYFYRQAAKKSEEDPDSSEVDETSFRYPGPRPQSKEAGVLMLADAAESICRTLVDPAPSRIEHVVHDLVLKRLMDGQFDECSLTLKELHLIEDSLVKSLTAVYHGRVKYPDQQTA